MTTRSRADDKGRHEGRPSWHHSENMLPSDPIPQAWPQGLGGCDFQSLNFGIGPKGNDPIVNRQCGMASAGLRPNRGKSLTAVDLDPHYCCRRNALICTPMSSNADMSFTLSPAS